MGGGGVVAAATSDTAARYGLSETDVFKIRLLWRGG
jgi:hypothetical protein